MRLWPRLRTLGGAALLALLTLLALCASLWWWSGTAHALRSAIDLLAHQMPPGQQLRVQAVTGSLRAGGHIGSLHWQRGDLTIEAQDLELRWDLGALLAGELRLQPVRLRQLRIDDRSVAPQAPTAPTLPADLSLPFRLSAPWRIDSLQWRGRTDWQAQALAGEYRFDGREHQLSVRQLAIASGTYDLSARLQARAPMALALSLHGSVQTTLPAARTPLTVQARAEVSGQLAGRDAALDLQAHLSPAPVAGSATGPQADLTARIQPWQTQPITRASARWRDLDLAALWPQASQTALSGAVTIEPRGPGWRAALTLSNAASGPWDRQRLPLDSLAAQGVFDQGQWLIESLQASGAAGRIRAQGRLTQTSAAGSPPLHWQGQASLRDINPAALDTRLPPALLAGSLTAQHSPAGLQFSTQLQAAASRSRRPDPGLVQRLCLQQLALEGVWQSPTLQLRVLHLQSDDAQLQGALQWNYLSQAVQGRLALVAPSTQATLAGQLARTQGAGQFRLQVADAGRATRWLQRWPLGARLLTGPPVEGAAELSGHWQGGWQSAGQDLQLQVHAQASRLAWAGVATAAAPPWQLRDWQADLRGRLGAFSLSTSGQLETATHRLTLQAQGDGAGLPSGAGHLQLQTLRLEAQERARPGTWTMQTSAPLRLDWSPNQGAPTLSSSAGAARLSGPLAGSPVIRWQPARWTLLGTPSARRAHWQTQGQLEDLPLAWLERLSPTPWTSFGLGGDLRFGGQWKARSGDTLHLRATLARSGGDLHWQGDGSHDSVRAGLSQARLQLSAEGEQLTAQLAWASERAGQAQAEIQTRLRHEQGAWSWPADAPLQGSLRAQLPPIAAWSMLAPPGWRLRGTLEADATLSGTRAAPQWHGTLQARELALRSVSDGIDFSQGTLRATLEGQRLDIQAFTLHGAGRDAGRLSGSGRVEWLPAVPPNTALAARLRLSLEAQAHALRVMARSDRSLVLSGTLAARLEQAHLNLRGALRADQALFLLPDDTAPRLGADVRVRAGPAAPRANHADGPAVAWPTLSRDILISLDPGPDFQLRGRGLVTRLAGQLELRSQSGRTPAPRLNGELHTVGGSYRAYGQPLDIEQGVLRFTGTYDNPALDILAIRPNLPQRVGVQLRGSALSPLVRLYAEPDLPEAEKLAWLVLGRSGANGGAETALLQQAALALLGGNARGLSGGLADALGLDELAVRGAAGTTDGAPGALVTLGKRVSRDFYVAYERGLASTLGTFYIFYDLSRRFTLRAQTGEQSAIDLIFTLRYD